MTIQQAMTTMAEKLTNLEQALDHLSWAIVQGQPPLDADDGSPAGHFDDLVLEMRGWVVEAKDSIRDDRWCIEGQISLPHLRRTLVTCQEYCLKITDLFHERLASPQCASNLRQLVRDRGPEWQQWALGVRDALEHCRVPIFEMNQALIQCCQEASEQADSLSITVRLLYID